jgi:hypothetical protein
MLKSKDEGGKSKDEVGRMKDEREPAELESFN